MKDDRFRFRVWDKVNEQYLPTCDIAIDCVFRVYLWDREHDEWVWYSNDPLIEQCTGLKDKNGKLIYEGDVVNLYPAETINHKERIVVWGRCGWTTVRKNTSIYCNFGSHEIEVIGNIHEQKGEK